MKVSGGSGSRAGFGTTTTFVLVIIGIALLILLGGDMLSRGSRVSIERAYITGQLLRIAAMAIDEAMTSDAGQEKLAESMLKALGQGTTAPPKTDYEGRNTLINGFLDAITPLNSSGVLASINQGVEEANVTSLVPHKFPFDDTGTKTPGMFFWGVNGRVVFGTDSNSNTKYPLDTLKIAYKQEVEANILKLEPVEIRVVAFRATTERAQPPLNGDIRAAFSPGARMGWGLARAKVTVGWVVPRKVEGKEFTVQRTVTCDRFFELLAPQNIQGTGATPDENSWQIRMGTEWQREAVGD